MPSFPGGRPILKTAAGVLLLAWALWWTASFAAQGQFQGRPIWMPRLLGARTTWIPAWTYLGLDFTHSYYAVQHLVRGESPYVDRGEVNLGRGYAYHPVTLPFFAWSYPLGAREAAVTWAILIALMAAWGALEARRRRALLGLQPPPGEVALAAVLLSYPVLFEMERGNFHTLVLLMIILSVRALERRSILGDLLAGLALAVAAWMKIYPALLIVPLVALRRRRAALFMAGWALVIPLVTWPWTRQWLAVAYEGFGWRAGKANLLPYAHSLSAAWPILWRGGPLDVAAALTGTVAAVLILIPLLAWVGLKVHRSQDASRLAYPFLLWTAGLATFLPSPSIDYNLLFLPVAALIIWDRRDPARLHLLMAAMLLWWQPLRLPLGGARIFFLLKLAGVLAVAAGLLVRLEEHHEKSLEGPDAAGDTSKISLA